MTVPYNTKVTDAGLITFVRLFFRWKGSVWKAVWKELILWLTLYFTLNLSYRFVMTELQRSTFERVCKFFRSYTDFIPLTFMLGFFVNLVVNRWWTMWENIGWVDTVSLFINGHIPGNDEMSRMFRRNIIRYLLFFKDISTPIRKRFPSLETFIVAGYITEQELDDYQNTPTTYKNYYTPIRWALNLVRQARAANRIHNDYAVAELFKEILDFRGKMGVLLTYDFQPIPLIYTVVVCLSVRLYFISALLGRQIVINDKDEIDTFVPMMTIVQFIFYMGWMKVAEALLNPFGDDDDDFECNWLLDRNFEVGFIIADQNNDRALVKDRHWNTQKPEPLYSIDTVNAEVHPLIGSAARRSSIQAQQKNFTNFVGNSDVIMIARTPQNINEDAISIGSFGASGVPVGTVSDVQKIHVRRPSRILSAENLANGFGGCSGLIGIPNISGSNESQSGSGIINNARRKLSRMTSAGAQLKPLKTVSNQEYCNSVPPDFAENGLISPLPPVEEYIFIRKNTLQLQNANFDGNSVDFAEENRRHAPSIIREESDERFDQSDETSENCSESSIKNKPHKSREIEDRGHVNEAVDLVDEICKPEQELQARNFSEEAKVQSKIVQRFGGAIKEDEK